MENIISQQNNVVTASVLLASSSESTFTSMVSQQEELWNYGIVELWNCGIVELLRPTLRVACRVSNDKPEGTEIKKGGAS